ncbi:hypothetical protein ACJX0J_010360, partial [Zea mays]
IMRIGYMSRNLYFSFSFPFFQVCTSSSNYFLFHFLYNVKNIVFAYSIDNKLIKLTNLMQNLLLLGLLAVCGNDIMRIGYMSRNLYFSFSFPFFQVCTSSCMW